MPAAPLPANEAERLAALASYDVLDTACEDTFDDITRMAARVTGCPIALISLVDAKRQWFKARHGLDLAETPRADAFCAWAILQPETLIVPDATADGRFADNPLVTQPEGFRFYAGAPLVAPDGAAVGTLCVLDRTTRDLAPEAQDTLRGLARTVVTALELRRAMRDARQIALTDALTGLGNRMGFFARLRDATDARTGFGLLYLDLDGFKQINDRLGHEAGDRVLVALARTIGSQTRASDYAARLGGDEFALLLHCGNEANFRAAAERVAQDLRACADGGGVTASIGAIWCAGQETDAASLLGRADALMYAAKSAGKDRVAFERPEERHAA